MEKKTADEQLRQYAITLGTSMRDIRQLVLQVYIDDENYQKRIAESIQHQVNNKQLALQDVQLRNYGMEAVILERKLNRMISRVKRIEKIKSFFTFTKKKSHEPVTGN
jgi:hypothetical protein